MTHRIEDVVSRGMCIGCGVCAVATNGAIQVRLDASRLYQADISNASSGALRAASRVCPFSDEAPNEDDLGVPHGDAAMQRHPQLGTHIRTLAGRVNAEGYVWGSSSGGMTSWLTRKLIEVGIIDAVLSVGRPGPTDHELFGYAAAEESEIPGRRKSCYYATTMAEVLGVIGSTNLRFALIGVPCNIKAARALCDQKPELSAHLAVFIGLVCGHYKTQAFAESLAWQLGISPEHLAEVDFRVKNPSLSADHYNFGARAIGEDHWRYAPTRDLVGGNWGHNAFQPEACNFCDDVVAECSDISFGDAWLPEFAQDSRGTNLIISRNRMLDEILDAAASSGEITLIPLAAADAVQSQAGGFRHRREGLALRLSDDQSAGLSVPRKRVAPDGHAVSEARATLLRQRRRMAKLSHQAFSEARASGDLGRYKRAMTKEIRRYRRLDGPLISRALSRARRFINLRAKMLHSRMRSVIKGSNS
ncbi:coenzyme F420 hydrogenase [Acidipropionibacterium jensenii]|uniref:Coenzyme F420 hydrogenase/dehydrogenase, beta subunit C-terminal domain n=1 Tax=Acidipropionibacterium jensenii TaxID=1749 RepID=UPI00110B3446|nr:Coenzyme F420 hydrogenase/dehydrogenase, beta subunit C-terminal domain [Acidipropionibacterium jensenii]QCV87444.1 coenzyme F420 hydrogenase [Acidipropionibacterium jensenii]